MGGLKSGVCSWNEIGKGRTRGKLQISDTAHNKFPLATPKLELGTLVWTAKRFNHSYARTATLYYYIVRLLFIDVIHEMGTEIPDTKISVF